MVRPLCLMQQQHSSDLNALTVLPKLLDFSSWSLILESQVVYIHAAYERNCVIFQAESCQETIIVALALGGFNMLVMPLFMGLCSFKVAKIIVCYIHIIPAIKKIDMKEIMIIHQANYLLYTSLKHTANLLFLCTLIVFFNIKIWRNVRRSLM